MPKPVVLLVSLAAAHPEVGNVAEPEARGCSSDDDVWRIVIPVGRTGLQRIVVDLTLTPVAGADPPVTEIRLRAFGKEGLLSRKPTAKTADRVWTALAG